MQSQEQEQLRVANVEMLKRSLVILDEIGTDHSFGPMKGKDLELWSEYLELDKKIAESDALMGITYDENGD